MMTSHIHAVSQLPSADDQPTGGQLRPPSHSSADVPYAPGLKLARALGWFSLALGAAELAAPRTVEQLTGIRSPNLLRAYGLREMATGIGILSSKRPARWMWARVAGDLLDLATLLAPLRSSARRRRRQALGAAAAVAGVTVADAFCATQLTAAENVAGSGYRRADAGQIVQSNPGAPS